MICPSTKSVCHEACRRSMTATGYSIACAINHRKAEANRLRESTEERRRESDAASFTPSVSANDYYVDNTPSSTPDTFSGGGGGFDGGGASGSW